MYLLLYKHNESNGLAWSSTCAQQTKSRPTTKQPNRKSGLQSLVLIVTCLWLSAAQILHIQILWNHRLRRAAASAIVCRLITHSQVKSSRLLTQKSSRTMRFLTVACLGEKAKASRLDKQISVLINDIWLKKPDENTLNQKLLNWTTQVEVLDEWMDQTYRAIDHGRLRLSFTL